MKIIATQTTGKELKPGDIYSHMSQEQWDYPRRFSEAMGEVVWIRSEMPIVDTEMDSTVYKIEVIK